MHHVSGVTSTMTGSAPGGDRRVRGGRERERRDDHLVAPADAERLQRDLHRDRAVRHEDAVRRALVRGERLLEPSAVPAGLGEPAPVAAADDVGDGLDLAIVAARPRRVRARAHRCAAVERQFVHRSVPRLRSVSAGAHQSADDAAGVAVPPRACLDSGEWRSVASLGIVRKVSFALGEGPKRPSTVRPSVAHRACSERSTSGRSSRACAGSAPCRARRSRGRRRCRSRPCRRRSRRCSTPASSARPGGPVAARVRPPCCTS